MNRLRSVTARWRSAISSGSRGSAFGEIVMGAAVIAAMVVASPFVRTRYNRSGATDDEVTSPMPGDDLVPDPKLGFTRAITVDAPPEDVWPWLVQIGQGRCGLYSYDGLENLVGCDIHSANEIQADHQDLEVGDLIRSGPDSYPCWMVVDIEPVRHLVLLGAGTPAETEVPGVVEEIPAKGYSASTWQWQLSPGDGAGGGTTRVVVRQRLTYSPGQALVWRLVEPINFVMEHKMLRGIKARAERWPSGQ